MTSIAGFWSVHFLRAGMIVCFLDCIALIALIVVEDMTSSQPSLRSTDLVMGLHFGLHFFWSWWRNHQIIPWSTPTAPSTAGCIRFRACSCSQHPPWPPRDFSLVGHSASLVGPWNSSINFSMRANDKSSIENIEEKRWNKYNVQDFLGDSHQNKDVSMSIFIHFSFHQLSSTVRFQEFWTRLRTTSHQLRYQSHVPAAASIGDEG